MEVFEQQSEAPTPSYDVLETEATIHFVTKVHRLIGTSKIILHTGNLHNFIQETCVTKIKQRRPILLFLYKDDDEFSKKFLSLLKSEMFPTFINENFFFLGWDIQSEYLSALNYALEAQGLFNVIEFLNDKTSALFVIAPIEDMPRVQFCFRGKIVEKDLIKDLKSALETFKTQNDNELNLLQLTEETTNETDIGSEEYQQMMAELLGDRDYDCLEFNQHHLVKSKIGFALFGPPSQRDDSSDETPAKYEEKEQERIDKLYKIIREKSNEFAEFKDRILMSVIYNCTEPLPEEKLKRAKKFKDYNAKTDLYPAPIFVLRKCINSDQPCRIFIDDIGRVYSSWGNYLRNNKLHECRMVVPKNGRYEFDSKNKVLLEYHLSPACDLDVKILKGVDIASTVTGVVSTGIIVAAAIPAITVAPVVLAVGLGTGIGVGIYSMGRSLFNLVDRKKHSQTMSFVDSEARGAYLNIVAGSLGFVGAGANVVVSQLVVKGVNIGKGASAVVNTINIANLAANGLNVGNCTYEILNKWIKENETPSAFTIFQLSTSILFFGNAVYNFKTVSTIVEETQSGFLKEYQDSLRSNRHRKMFNKLTKETIRQQGGDTVKGRAEVIKTVSNIKNKDEVFASLTRNNKALNKNGVKFSAEGGKISLNGQTVDMAQFATISKDEIGSFLNNLSPSAQPTPAESAAVTNQIQSIFTTVSQEDVLRLCAVIPRLLSKFEEGLRECILQAMNFLMSKMDLALLNKLKVIFPGMHLFVKLLDTICNFIGNHAKKLEKDYELWNQTGNDRYYSSLFEYVDQKILMYTEKTMYFFKLAFKVLFADRKLTRQASAELYEYFKAWFTKACCDNMEEIEQERNVRLHSARWRVGKLSCHICKGQYYKPLYK